MQEAQEIFGDVSGLLEEYGQRQRGGPDAGDEQEDADMDALEGLGGDEGEDAAEERQRQQVRKSLPCTASFLACTPITAWQGKDDAEWYIARIGQSQS